MQHRTSARLSWSALVSSDRKIVLYLYVFLSLGRSCRSCCFLFGARRDVVCTYNFVPSSTKSFSVSWNLQSWSQKNSTYFMEECQNGPLMHPQSGLALGLVPLHLWSSRHPSSPELCRRPYKRNLDDFVILGDTLSRWFMMSQSP